MPRAGPVYWLLARVIEGQVVGQPVGGSASRLHGVGVRLCFREACLHDWCFRADSAAAAGSPRQPGSARLRWARAGLVARV